MALVVLPCLVHIMLTTGFLPANTNGLGVAPVGGVAQQYTNHIMLLFDIQSDYTGWEALWSNRQENTTIQMKCFLHCYLIAPLLAERHAGNGALMIP